MLIIYLPIAIISGVITDVLLKNRLRQKQYPFTVLLCLIVIIILCIAFDNQVLIIKGYIFAQILIFAAYHDSKTKEIPDSVHVLIILTALIGINPISSIIGLVAVSLPFLLASMFREGSIGGGDIKLMGACGFLLGAVGGFFASIAGLVLAICFNLFNNKSKSESFPLAPYLAAGCFAAYLIFY